MNFKLFIIMVGFMLGCGICYDIGTYTANDNHGLTPQESDYQINKELAKLLTKLDGPIRSRVSLINSTISQNMVGYDQTPMYKFDVIYGQSIAGYDNNPDSFVKNIPLSQMDDYLKDLIKNKCVFVASKDLSDKNAKLRLNASKISTFIACPIFDSANSLLGGLFVSWADQYKPIDKSKIDDYKTIIAISAHRISLALEWRIGPALY